MKAALAILSEPEFEDGEPSDDDDEWRTDSHVVHLDEDAAQAGKFDVALEYDILLAQSMARSPLFLGP